MKIYHNIEQGTELWHLLRLGMPTTSNFGKIHNAAGSVSKQRARLLNELAAELVYQRPVEQWRGGQMIRGHEQEPEARDLYLETKGLELGVSAHQVGFIRVDDPMVLGGSPDLVVGSSVDRIEGGAEFKSVSSTRMWEYLKAPGVPNEHMPQVQGLMMLTGTKWWDLCLYCPGEELQIMRVPEDKAYQKDLRKALVDFYKQLEADLLLVKKQTIYTYRQALDDRLAEEVKAGRPEPIESEPTENVIPTGVTGKKAPKAKTTGQAR